VLNPSETTYAFAVTVEYTQPVTVSSTKASVLASTWSTRGVSIVGRNNFARSVRQDVRDAVDKFINAYLSVNPKP
jgi:hypothetical protein